jgi:hypothetical protein
MTEKVSASPSGRKTSVRYSGPPADFAATNAGSTGELTVAIGPRTPSLTQNQPASSGALATAMRPRIATSRGGKPARRPTPSS